MEWFPRVRALRFRQRVVATLGCLSAAISIGTAAPSLTWAACNLIPQTEKSFDSVRGATTRPFAAPGEPIEVRLRPCDTGSSVISNNATDHLVTVVFTPTAGGPANAVVLTAAADCSAVTPLLSACKAQLGTGSDAKCVSGTTAGMQVTNRNSTNYLRFNFPDSAAAFGGALAGPASIAVTSASPGSLPCQLATSSCVGQSGLVACVDDFFANDGACGRGGLQGTFNHFTALPAPNDFQADCWETMGPCTALGTQFRMATDKDGNVLVPMDWRGILVRQDQVPVPRLLTATIASPLPIFGVHVPGKSFVASYTPEGGLLPPIFEPESDATVPVGVLSLFGSADAPYTVLRMARRSDTYQQCSGGTNDGLPCNVAEDCPNGVCGPTVCAGGDRAGLPCSSDGACPGSECGPELVDLRGLGQSGNGPIVLSRFGAGICQIDGPVNTCSANAQCDMGSGTCVSYALTAQNPVPLEGLALSPDVFAFAVNEAVDGVQRNNDGDSVDTVVTLRDRTTGQEQPLGAPPAICGIPANPPPEGRAVIRTQQSPFSFPAVATEGDVVAFLESEATTNNPSVTGNPACDMNGNGTTADAILRVYKLGSGEVTPSVPNPVADGALQINGRALAVSNGRVFFRSSEAAAGAQRTERISLDPMGNQLNNLSTFPAFSSYSLPHISYNGRDVLFDAYDPAVIGQSGGQSHHFIVRDVKLGVNDFLNLEPGSYEGSISADGRWVVYAVENASIASVSIPTCTNTRFGTTPCDQVALRDRCISNNVPVPSCTPSTELISADVAGNAGNDYSWDPTVSADGRYVAFISWATNLVTLCSGGSADDQPCAVNADCPGGTCVNRDTNVCDSSLHTAGSCPDVMIHDRCQSNGVPVPGCRVGTRLVSVKADGTQVPSDHIHIGDQAIISANGRVVAFTYFGQLDPRDPATRGSVYVHDFDTGQVEKVDFDSFGNSADSYGEFPSLSADGRYVLWDSNADNLVPGDTNSGFDVFVHDRVTGTTERVSVDSNGIDHLGTGGSGPGMISADGRLVIFGSYAPNLVAGVSDVYPHGHIYMHDRATGVTQLVDISTGGAVGDGQVNFDVGVSGDGRTVAFASVSSNLVAGDTNDFCDDNGDQIYNENCSDIFVRGIDPNSSSGDLTGDGQPDDTVLRVMSSSDGTVSALCPADQVSVVAGAAAFLRPESAGATSNSGCTGPGLTGPDLNGDGDTNDDIVHFVSAANSVQNLQVAATSVVLSGVCAGGTNATQPCTTDAACPGSSCTPTYVSALVSEAGQNNTNLNGDSDTNDSVLQVYDLSSALPTWTNIGQAADTLDASGSLVAYITPEADQNADLNGDGDTGDRVLQIYDASTNTRVNTHMAADDFVLGSDLDVCTTTPLVAFRSPEAARCTVPLDDVTCHNLPPSCPASKCDLNGDGDCCDSVLFVYAKGVGVLNTGQAATPCRLEACDPRLPYRVFGANVKFLTFEIEQNADLNGNGNATDLILQQYDACTKERKVISAVDTSSTNSDSTQDPTTGDPRTDGHTLITSSSRCYQGSTLLLVPATCTTLADCPPTATACQAELVVAAPGAVPQHDTVLVAAKAVNATIPVGPNDVIKTVGIKVRNGDVLPAKEKVGHTVRLSVEPGDCPPLIVDGIDFDPKTDGDQDTIVLKGGQTKAAKVRLRLNRDDFLSYNSKAPARCTLTVRATTVLLDNQDPTPRNNVQSLEVNVFDKNDSSTATFESGVQSVAPVKLTIAESGTPVTKTYGVKLVNGDLGELGGHDIALSIDQGDCPDNTVALVEPSTLTVTGGAKGTVHVSVTAAASGFTAGNSASPGRCTALLTATTAVMGNVEPNPRNNITHLTIDVNDKTDY